MNEDVKEKMTIELNVEDYDSRNDEYNEDTKGDFLFSHFYSNINSVDLIHIVNT